MKFLVLQYVLVIIISIINSLLIIAFMNHRENRLDLKKSRLANKNMEDEKMDKKSAVALTTSIVMQELIRENKRDAHNSNPIYFPPKRALRGNCKNTK